MPYPAAGPALRLALLSLFAVADTIPPEVCRTAVDAASDAIFSAPAAVVEGGTVTRFEAARILNSLCGSCRACGRGRNEEPAELTEPAPP